MRINKIMKQYYSQKIDALDGLPAMPIPKRSGSVASRRFTVSWSDAFGYALTGGMILHYFLRGRFYDVVSALPGVSILF